ncbi:hypothetical protein [Aestuariibaculum sediminum]|uniref:Uncharacterized protein n=1 Tax=Aestuariibaculum sediminum TaxID=2770637 RepID=A0A8J6QKC3_9FLAO|nr:hypothetical protein [Aestuariibaculum sediminum]MBD0833124.1 hypothetical protein [Aestuariibaculum sediminum]
MAKKFIFWKGYCKASKFIALDKINHIISISGDIVDIKQFSDISISLKIEIEEQKIDTLYASLKTYIEIDEFDTMNSNSNKERTIFLNISFSSGKGDVKVDVPYV